MNKSIVNTVKLILSFLLIVSGLPSAGFADQNISQEEWVRILNSSTHPLNSSELDQYASASFQGSDLEENGDSYR
ncbi:MAG: hypothetical protein R2827_05050 [Bdellovibrionales bacterium]